MDTQNTDMIAELEALKWIEDGEDKAAPPPAGYGAAVDPKDLVRYTMLMRVIAWQIENGSTNISRACKALGYRRQNIYDALHSPWVVTQLEVQARALAALEVSVIGQDWLKVINTQLEIAKNPADKRASTGAAKFLADRMAQLQKMLQADEQESRTKGTGKAASRVDALLDQLVRGGGRVKVTAEVSQPTTIDG